MSYFNYLSARQYSFDSSNYGAPSNATINTDGLGDIILNPSPSASAIVPQLTLNSDTSGVTNPTITTDSSGDIILTPNTSSSVQIESNLTVTGTTLTLGNATSQNNITASGNLALNSGTGSTVQLNGAVVTLTGTSATNITNDLTIEGTTLTIGNSTSNSHIETAGNLYINSGSGDTLQLGGDVVTLEGTSAINLTGSTVIGNSNSSAISNIAFGTYTYSDISNADGGASYYSSSTINLSFVPTVITLGVSTTNNAIPYGPSLAYEVQATTSGYAYSFQIYLYLTVSNGSNSANYITTYIAIA